MSPYRSISGLLSRLMVLMLVATVSGCASLMSSATSRFADNLSAQKARVLLLVALTRTRDPEGLREIFHR